MEMKNTLSFAAVAVLAGLITTGTANAVTSGKPDTSSITAQSAQVHTNGLDAIYILDEGGAGARKFLFAGKPKAVEAFPTYFTYSIAWTNGSAQPNNSHIENAMHEGARLNSITRHLLGLFRGQTGARAFRRHLATEAVKPGAGVKVLREALGLVLDRNRELAQTAA